MMDPPTFSKSNDMKKERERRSSILKIGKPDDDNAPTQTANFGRRVSFADTHQVQEFLLFDSGHSENTSELIEKSTVGEYPLKLDLPILPDTRIQTKQLEGDEFAMPLKPRASSGLTSTTIVDENSAEMSLTLTIDNTIHCPKGTTLAEIIRHPTQSKPCHKHPKDNYNLEDMDLALIGKVATVTEMKSKPLLHHQSDFLEDKSSEIEANQKSKNIEYTQYTKDMSLTGAINKTIYARKNDQSHNVRSKDLFNHEKENVNINQLPELDLFQESDPKSNVSDMIFTRVINKTIYHEPKFENEEDCLVNLDIEEPSNVTKYSHDMSLTRHINKTITPENYALNQSNAVDCNKESSLTQHTDGIIFLQPKYDNLANSKEKKLTKSAKDNIEDICFVDSDTLHFEIEYCRNNLDSYQDDPNVSEGSKNSKKPANILSPKRENNTEGMRLYAELSKPVSLKKKIKPVRHVPGNSNIKAKSPLQRDKNCDEISTDFGVELNDNNHVIAVRMPSKRKSSESEDVISKYERKLESQVEVKHVEPAPQKTRSGVKKIDNGLFSKRAQNLCTIKPGSSITPKNGKALTQSNKRLYSTEPQEPKENIPIPLNISASMKDTDVFEKIEKEIKTKPSKKTFKLPQYLVKSNRDLKNKLDQMVKTRHVEDIKNSLDSFEPEKPNVLNLTNEVDDLLLVTMPSEKSFSDNVDGILNPNIDCYKLDQGKVVEVGYISDEVDSSVLKSKAKKAPDNNSFVKVNEFKTGYTKPKALDCLVTKPKALDSSVTKPKTLDSSVTKPKTQDSSVTKPKTQDSSVTKPKTQDSSVTKPKTLDSSVTKPKTLDSSVTNPKTLDSSVGKTNIVVSPTAKPKTKVSTTAKPKTMISSRAKTETVVSSNFQPETVVSPISKTKTVVSPIAKTKTVVSPIAKTKTVVSPIAKTKTVVSPIAKTKTVVSPIAKTKTVVSPIAKTKTVVYPIAETKTVVSPIAETKTVVSPIAKTKTVVSPIAKTKTVVSPIAKTKTVVSPIAKTTTVVSPIAKTTTVVSPIAKTTTVVSPIAKTTTVVSPIAKTKTVASPIGKNKTVVSPTGKTKNAGFPAPKSKTANSLVTKSKTANSSVTKSKTVDEHVTECKPDEASNTKFKSSNELKSTKSLVAKSKTRDTAIAKNNTGSKLETVEPPANLAVGNLTKNKAALENKLYSLENSMADNFQQEGQSFTTNITSIVDGQKEYLSDLSQIGDGEFKPRTSSTEILKPKVLKTCIEEVLDKRQVKGSEIVKEYLSGDNVVFEFPEWTYRVCISFSYVNYEWYNTSISSVNLLNPSKKLEWFEELAFIFVKYQLKELKFEEKQLTINELPKCLNYITDVILLGDHLQRDCENMELHYETTLNLKEEHAQIIEEMYSLSHRIIFDAIYTIDYKNYATKPMTLSFVVKMGTISSDLESNILSAVAKEQPGPDYIYRVSQIIKQYLRNNPVYNIPPPNKKLISWMY